jgi:hypothetical protein
MPRIFRRDLIAQLDARYRMFPERFAQEKGHSASAAGRLITELNLPATGPA